MIRDPFADGVVFGLTVGFMVGAVLAWALVSWGGA
jgi:hypothetical protein